MINPVQDQGSNDQDIDLNNMIDAAQSLTNDLTTHTTKKKRNRRKKKKKNAKRNAAITETTENSSETALPQKDNLDSILVGIEEYLQTNSDENEDVPVNIVSIQGLNEKSKKIVITEEDNVPNDISPIGESEDDVLVKRTFEDNFTKSQSSDNLIEENKIEENKENHISNNNKIIKQSIIKILDDDKSIKKPILGSDLSTNNETNHESNDNIFEKGEEQDNKGDNDEILHIAVEEADNTDNGESDKTENKVDTVSDKVKEKEEVNDKDTIDLLCTISNDEVGKVTSDNSEDNQANIEISAKSSDSESESHHREETNDESENVVEKVIEEEKLPVVSNETNDNNDDDNMHEDIPNVVTSLDDTNEIQEDNINSLTKKENDLAADPNINSEKSDSIKVGVTEDEPEKTNIYSTVDSLGDDIIVNVRHNIEIQNPNNSNEVNTTDVQSLRASILDDDSKDAKLETDKQIINIAGIDIDKDVEVKKQPTLDEDETNCPKDDIVLIRESVKESFPETDFENSIKEKTPALDYLDEKDKTEIVPEVQNDKLNINRLTDIDVQEKTEVQDNDIDDVIKTDTFHKNSDLNTIVKDDTKDVEKEKGETAEVKTENDIKQTTENDMMNTTSESTNIVTSGDDKKEVDDTTSEKHVDNPITIDNTKTEDDDKKIRTTITEEETNNDVDTTTGVIEKSATKNDKMFSEISTADIVTTENIEDTQIMENESQPSTNTIGSEEEEVIDEEEIDEGTIDEDSKPLKTYNENCETENIEAAPKEEADVTKEEKEVKEVETIDKGTVLSEDLQEEIVETEETYGNTETTGRDTVEGLDLGPGEATTGLDLGTSDAAIEEENTNIDVAAPGGKNSLDDILAETDAFLKELDFVDDSELNNLLESMEPNKSKTNVSTNDVANTIKKSDIRKLYENEPVYIYTSLAGGGFHMIPRTNRLATILQANQIKFTYRDLGTDDAARKVWKTHSRGRTLPGVVRGANDIIGNWEEIDDLNEDYRVHEAIYETL